MEHVQSWRLPDKRPIVQAHNLPKSHYPYYWLIIIIVIGPGTVIAGTTI